MRGLGVPLAFLGASGVYLVTSLTFPFGTGARPGAGFFPAAVGTYLCLIALVVVVTAWRRPARIPAAPVSLASDARRRVTAAAAGLVGFCVLLGWIGYGAAAFLFTATLLKCLGRGGWSAVLVTALVAAVGSYYLFGVLLGVPLPRGVFVG